VFHALNVVNIIAESGEVAAKEEAIERRDTSSLRQGESELKRSWQEKGRRGISDRVRV
jgi:hypothetical protein